VVPPAAAAVDPVVSTAPTRQVLIVAVDPVTGDRAQVECHAPANSFASDVIMVEAADFPAAEQACVDTGTPVMRSGDAY
jgi:hypothetical protein